KPRTKRRIDLLILDSKETISVANPTKDDLDVIDDGGVAIDRGKIVEAASSQLLQRKYSASRHILATDEIVLPGFVDPHTLIVFRRLKRQNPCKIAATFLGAHSIPTGMISKEYAKMVMEEMIPAVHQERLAEFCDVFCEKGVFNPELSKEILRAGIRNGLRP